MASDTLNPDARLENIRALAAAAGLSEDTAAARLEQEVLVTWDSNDQASSELVAELAPILTRTLLVDFKYSSSAKKQYAAEIVIGSAAPLTSCPQVFCVLRTDRCVVSQKEIRNKTEAPPHRLMTLVSACYLAGAAIRLSVGQDMPNPPPKTFEIIFSDLIDPAGALTDPIDIGESYLAGAGAIGNGFLWAARYIHLKGILHIVDYDRVSGGNLQRQIWFNESDIGQYKANILYKKAQPSMFDCQLVPSITRLQEHKNRIDGPWLKRLIVGVDSRRARRHLQNELPGEVFDASTSGSQEIVLHYNRQPTDLACMGCIYFQDEGEISHDQSLADHLGIDVSDLKTGQIDARLAVKICEMHPQLDPAKIIGEAFDSLYKQLCSSQQLKSLKGEQVIAPFAFISVLAGSLLLLEVIKRLNKGSYSQKTNDWRINPWREPFPQMRQARPRRAGCECCSIPEIQKANSALWAG